MGPSDKACIKVITNFRAPAAMADLFYPRKLYKDSNMADRSSNLTPNRQDLEYNPMTVHGFEFKYLSFGAQKSEAISQKYMRCTCRKKSNS